MEGFLAFCVATLAYALVAKRLSSTILTAPMLFLMLGVGFSVTGLMPAGAAIVMLDPVAEVALVVLLFLDAAQTDLRALRRRHVWPLRMLVFGLPLAIGLGTAVGLILLPGWPLLTVVLVAAILAPTDAALGQAVISNGAVPVRTRRALTVESGLNDGLSLPVILFFAALATASETQESAYWLVFGAKQIVLGPIVGACVGGVGGWALLKAKEAGSTSEIYEGIGALSIAGGAYLAAVLIGGNGFISAFVAGLLFGVVVNKAFDFVFEFTESEGQLLTWTAFFLLGAALVPEAVAHLTPSVFALIVISFLVVRPLAIWVSLLGSDAQPVTKLFFGWFGPRGLATALFALLVMETLPDEMGMQIRHIAINAVWISALLHGVTAAPGARWYAGRIARIGPCAETVHDEEREPRP